jgi:hypothetical protein
MTFERVDGLPPNVPDHSWNVCDHSTFNVRVGPDYNRYKKKGPSEKPLYEAIGVDAFWYVHICKTHYHCIHMIDKLTNHTQYVHLSIYSLL